MNKENYEEQLRNMEQRHHFALSQISHEIRNPVTLINSFLQLIESGHPEVTRFEYWDQVMSNMDYLKALLDEISGYNRSMTIHTQPVNLYHLLESITADVTPVLFQKNIRVHLKKDSALPPIDADPVKVKEILHNLIRNSAEAIGENGNITLSIGFESLSVVVTVSDDGPGIPKEYLPTLFDPFVTHKKEGTGLGLSITKNVMTAHKGTVDVQSQEGKGTVFTLLFPI